MSSTPLRRSNRSASRDVADTPVPVPVPPRGTRASSRASSRAVEGTGPLPSLIGRASSAYGSPTQVELVNAIVPNKKASSLFAELAAKRHKTDPHATSDLDPQYPPATRRPAAKRSAATAAFRPSVIQEEEPEGQEDQYAPANTTSNLGQQGIYRQTTPLHQHARQGALPPRQRARTVAWLASLKNFRWRTAAIAVAVFSICFAILLPWIPSADDGTILDRMKDRHYDARTFVSSLFEKSEAATVSYAQDYSRLSRQINNLQVGQEQLTRRFGGQVKAPDAAVRMAKNYEDATSQVNFFSAKLGAMVDVVYSSPTRQPRKSSFFDQVFTGFRTLEPNEHITALLPWQEAGDCWCAPSASQPGQAKAQLAIRMPRQMIPTTVTIEHHPQKGLLEPGTTPRDMSVWIQVTDKALRNEITGDSAPPNPADTAMPDDYVEVAHFSYVSKPHDGNHIQTFGMQIPLAKFADKGLAVTRAIVRVNSNHGADYTCLYRVRMHGHLVDSQDPVYNELHMLDVPSWGSSW